LFTREAFPDYVSRLMFSRPPWLDILVHPLTRSQLLDHTRRALCLGTPLEMNCTILKEADARLLAAVWLMHDPARGACALARATRAQRCR